MGQQGVARRARRSLVSRVSAGHLVMVLAGSLGVVLTLRVLASADDATPMLVAAADLAPGTVLDDDVLTTAPVSGDGRTLGGFFAADDIAAVRGYVVTRAIDAGALVTRGDVSEADAGSAPRAMSFPLAAARAVGGDIDAGDRVDVIEVDGDSGRAGYVMTDVEVLDVDGDNGGPLTGGGDELTVTIVVDSDSALALAAALESGTVSLVRATGASAIEQPVRPPVTDPAGEPASDASTSR